METRFIRTLILFFILTIVFGILEHFWPSIPNQPKLRRGLGVDVLYWFFTPLVTQVLVMVAVAIVALPIYVLLGRSLDINSILAGYGPVEKIPLWQQGLIVIVLGDFIGYWTHRINHTITQLWMFHAVHHSSETVDWLTAVRIHPVNDVFSKGIQALPIVLLGFSPIAVELYTPLLSSYIALIHANVSWNYGPFRYAIASPAFHRWHHEIDKKAWGKNYAGLFPIYDVIFGTFYLPLNQQPKEFGIYGEKMTENFIDQMLYPFRNWKFPRRRLNTARTSR
ncbi:MAG: sterol desaturase family protein [Acaryochloridaceae cyanobacterium RU_4_10]|nr:sterol desaturase family protein [Acaryochloridaceae cyanobacterium RU_4_10]